MAPRNTITLNVDTSLRRQVATAVRNSQRFFAELTGANDPASRGAARVLMASIRKKLAVKAAVLRKSFGGEDRRTEHSAPGEAPRSVSGRLRKSVGTEVVGGIRRVGVASFVGRLLEEGVDTTVNVTPSGRAVGSTRKSKATGKAGRLRRRKGGNARRTLKIARRPFMEAAYEDAQPKMEGEAVSALQARDRQLRSFA